MTALFVLLFASDLDEGFRRESAILQRVSLHHEDRNTNRYRRALPECSKFAPPEPARHRSLLREPATQIPRTAMGRPDRCCSGKAGADVPRPRSPSSGSDL